MALWKESPVPAPAKNSPDASSSSVTALHGAPPAAPSSGTAPTASRAETVISAGMIMEGKIASGDDVRIAGRFRGDVGVDGNFRIDPNGRLEGQVKSDGAIIGGELQGNIDAAKHVELQTTGVIVGDIRAASFTVAAGSRMRGNVDFGWDNKATTGTGR